MCLIEGNLNGRLTCWILSFLFSTLLIALSGIFPFFFLLGIFFLLIVTIVLSAAPDNEKHKRRRRDYESDDSDDERYERSRRDRVQYESDDSDDERHERSRRSSQRQRDDFEDMERFFHAYSFEDPSRAYELWMDLSDRTKSLIARSNPEAFYVMKQADYQMALIDHEMYDDY